MSHATPGTDEAPALKVMTYQVRDDAVEATKAVVRDVVAAIGARGHAGRYLSAHVTGTGTFAHVLDPVVEPVLRDLPEFAAFQAHLRDALVGAPSPHGVTLVAGTLTLR